MLLGRTDTVRILLEHGADVKAKTTNDKTVLDLVIILGNTYPETIELIKNTGGERAKVSWYELKHQREHANRPIAAIKACDIQKVQQFL